MCAVGRRGFTAPHTLSFLSCYRRGDRKRVAARSLNSYGALVNTVYRFAILGIAIAEIVVGTERLALGCGGHIKSRRAPHTALVSFSRPALERLFLCFALDTPQDRQRVPTLAGSDQAVTFESFYRIGLADTRVVSLRHPSTGAQRGCCRASRKKEQRGGLISGKEPRNSSLTAPMRQKPGVRQGPPMDFVLRNWPADSGCQGNDNLGQLCPPHLGRSDRLQASLYVVSFLLCV